MFHVIGGCNDTCLNDTYTIIDSTILHHTIIHNYESIHREKLKNCRKNSAKEKVSRKCFRKTRERSPFENAQSVFGQSSEHLTINRKSWENDFGKISSKLFFGKFFVNVRDNFPFGKYSFPVAYSYSTVKY